MVRLAPVLPNVICTHGQAAAAVFASRSRALSVIRVQPVVLSGTRLEASSSNSGSRETGLLRRE